MRVTLALIYDFGCTYSTQHTNLSVMQFRFEDCHRTFRRTVSVILNVHVSIAGTPSFTATQNGFFRVWNKRINKISPAIATTLLKELE
jgi:hypothetical protein